MMINWEGKPYPWATDFDNFVQKNLESRNDVALINYSQNKNAANAHPSYDHYLPLIYALGAGEGEKVEFYNKKIVMGSIGMRCAIFGKV